MLNNKGAQILFGHPDLKNLNLPFLNDNPSITKTDQSEKIDSLLESNNFTHIISAADYEGNFEGLGIIENLRKRKIKKIIFSDKLLRPGMIDYLKEIKADIIYSEESFTLEALTRSDSPLKKEGEILVYFSSLSSMYSYITKRILKKYKQVVINTYNLEELQYEFSTNRFKVIIDTSPFCGESSLIQQAYKEFDFLEIPIFVSLPNPLNIDKPRYKLQPKIISTINKYS